VLVRVLSVVVVIILKQKFLHINSKVFFAKKIKKGRQGTSTAVTKGLANLKTQLTENEDLLEEHFFNEKRNCLGKQDSNNHYSLIYFLY
jgi:hypothetical protein